CCAIGRSSGKRGVGRLASRARWRLLERSTSASKSAFSRVAGRPPRSRSRMAPASATMRGWSAASVASRRPGGSGTVTFRYFRLLALELFVDDVRDARKLVAVDLAGNRVGALRIDPVEDIDEPFLDEPEGGHGLLVLLAHDVE